MSWTRVAPVLCLGLLAALVSSCHSAASESASIAESEGPSSSASVGQAAWIAVYDTARDPGDLEVERQQIVDALGDALAGSIVVSPSGCFEGIPPEVDRAGYVLALQQSDRPYVKALTGQLDGRPEYVGAVTVLCTD